MQNSKAKYRYLEVETKSAQTERRPVPKFALNQPGLSELLERVLVISWTYSGG